TSSRGSCSTRSTTSTVCSCSTVSNPTCAAPRCESCAPATSRGPLRRRFPARADALAPSSGGPVRLAVFGTPHAAVPPLEALHVAGHEIAVVVTQPDRRRARRSPPTPTPVRVAAERLGLAVRTPERARDVVDDVRAASVDLGVVVAF